MLPRENLPIQVLIRKVRLTDAEAIVALLNPIIKAGKYTVLDGPLTVEVEREFIASFPRRGVFQVAERQSDGVILGFQTIEPFATYTRALLHVAIIGTFVDLAHRRRGIGLRLSSVAFEAARAKGFEKLFSYVRADNPQALAFYLGLGFRIVGTAKRQAKIGRAYVDEVIIERFL